jgi:hypothetical protein
MPLTHGLDHDRLASFTTFAIAPPVEPRQATYFYVLKDDHIIDEFCVANSEGPVSVESYIVDPKLGGGPAIQKWDSFWRGNLLVFKPPDSYVGDQGWWVHYDRRLMTLERMDLVELDRHALRMRTSIIVPAR